MDCISPKRKSTEISQDLRQWVPSSFSNFFYELDHIIASCRNPFSLPLFRGHANSEWVPDCSFVRNCVRLLYDVYKHQLLPEDIRRSGAFHNAVASLLLTKFGHLHHPDDESFDLQQGGIDPWHELMVDLRRFPLKDSILPGTFLFEMTTSRDIGLYFATFDQEGENINIGSVDGTLCICDPVETNISLTGSANTVGDLLNLLAKPEFQDGDRTFPFLFQPAGNGAEDDDSSYAPVYLAQMDFRYSLDDIWSTYEQQYDQQVFVSLVLKEDIKKSVANYLETSGISEKIACSLPATDAENPACAEDITDQVGSHEEQDAPPCDSHLSTSPQDDPTGVGLSYLNNRFRTTHEYSRIRSSGRQSTSRDFRFWPG